MSTDEKIEEAIKPLVEMYSNIESDLLREIASHFLIGEEFENADYYRIIKLQEMGAFNQKTIKYLSKITGKAENEIKKCLREIGIITIDNPELSKLYKDGTIKIDPKQLLKSDTITTIIDSAYNEISNHFIELSSKIEKSTREAYLRVVEESYLDVSMGTHSYDEAIRKSIDRLSNSGIDIIAYETKDENGNVVGIRNYNIEGVVRRDSLTAARQLSGNLNNKLIDETECKYVKYSEHLDCRDTHFPWQGTIVKTEDWKLIADYGDVVGIYGINCRHYVEPYFGDKRGNEEKKYSKEECHEAYVVSQKQRYLERGVRTWKRKSEMFKATGDVEAYKKSKDKVLEWSDKLDKFVSDNGRQRDFTREYVKNNKDKDFNSKYRDYIKELKTKEKNDIIVGELKDVGVRGKIDLNPTCPKDIQEYIFDDEHINKERKRNISKDEAIKYIKEASFSSEVWDGKFVNYYSHNGATYVNMKEKKIRTCYNSKDFDEKIKKIMEVLEKYGK